MTRFRVGAIMMVAMFAAACAPRLKPLPGTSVRRAVPRAELPAGYHRAIFQWELQDPEMHTRGDGAARVAAPDSGRLDFFLAGGLASGAAVLIRDQLRLPSGVAETFVRRLVPPPPLLWASLGRLALPALRDTAVRVDGDTLRADIGAPVVFRVTFVRDTLRRVERIEGARIVEWVERFSDRRVRYRHEGNRRQLDLVVTSITPTGPFDAAIWTLP